MTPLAKARALALLVPLALLAGAYGFQYIWATSGPARCAGGSAGPISRPCPSPSPLLLAGRLPDRGRSFVWLAALAILVSGAIGVYHAGVELKLFAGVTAVHRRRSAARPRTC